MIFILCFAKASWGLRTETCRSKTLITWKSMLSSPSPLFSFAHIPCHCLWALAFMAKSMSLCTPCNGIIDNVFYHSLSTKFNFFDIHIFLNLEGKKSYNRGGCSFVILYGFIPMDSYFVDNHFLPHSCLKILKTRTSRTWFYTF